MNRDKEGSGNEQSARVSTSFWRWLFQSFWSIVLKFLPSNMIVQDNEDTDALSDEHLPSPNQNTEWHILNQPIDGTTKDAEWTESSANQNALTCQSQPMEETEDENKCNEARAPRIVLSNPQIGRVEIFDEYGEPKATKFRICCNADGNDKDERNYDTSTQIVISYESRSIGDAKDKDECKDSEEPQLVIPDQSPTTPEVKDENECVELRATQTILSDQSHQITEAKDEDECEESGANMLFNQSPTILEATDHDECKETEATPIVLSRQSQSTAEAKDEDECPDTRSTKSVLSNQSQFIAETGDENARKEPQVTHKANKSHTIGESKCEDDSQRHPIGGGSQSEYESPQARTSHEVDSFKSEAIEVEREHDLDNDCDTKDCAIEPIVETSRRFDCTDGGNTSQGEETQSNFTSFIEFSDLVEDNPKDDESTDEEAEVFVPPVEPIIADDSVDGLITYATPIPARGCRWVDPSYLRDMALDLLVKAGFEEEHHAPIFVTKAKLNGMWVPGRLVLDGNAPSCYVSYKGEDIRKKNFKILQRPACCRLKWVKVGPEPYEGIPVEGGETLSGDPLYIGRTGNGTKILICKQVAKSSGYNYYDVLGEAPKQYYILMHSH